MTSVIVLVAVTVPFSLALFGPHRQHRHHSTTMTVLTAVVVALVTTPIVLALFGRKIRRGQGMFAAPMVGGLQRADRRAANRAIRRGRPSTDPTLAAVERATAQQTIAQGRAGLVVFGIGGSGSFVEGLIHHGLAARVFYLAGAVMFGCFAVGQVWMLRVARRYLAVSESASAE
ncbi:MAG: hypothetical protein M3Y42_17510 [Actinomycetota bacterium]|nr:hypothetical protein [Actinomycetota bacterium]